jgi:site-specific DNA-methyltransferase (adenine-specific)
MCGDSTRSEDVVRLLGDEVVDLLWSDPPWGCQIRGRTKKALTIVNDDLGADGTRALVAAALRLAPLRPGGAFYVAAPAGPELHLAFLLALEDAGLTAHQTLAWVKDRFVLGHADYHARHENLLYGWKDGRAHYFVKDRTQDTVWEIPRPARSTSHPTMKPVELVARAIRNSSTPGQLVYDPFAGSGSTLVAAEQTGRRCRAMELDPRYAQVILERWAALVGTPAERVA